jgi:predicted Zn-dependent peptidase
MTISSIFFRRKAVFAAAGLMLAIAVASSAQPAKTPKQEKLLNGLRVIMFDDKTAEKVSVRVRIHSGSAFDPQGKEGVMKLLAAHIFPNSEAREFFTEELGGSLEIVGNYDYIQINASSAPDKFLDLLDTIANAINNVSITKDTTAKLRAEQVEKVKKLTTNPAYVADRAVAARLLGTFPYGRPEEGTTDSLARIDFADILFAKERFLTADNATVAISGNFDRALAFRALRRYFGTWLKADRKVPATFKQPDAPEPAMQTLSLAGTDKKETRFAIRGLARNDRDLAAAYVLSRVLDARLKAEGAPNSFVRHEAHVLPGTMIIGFTAAENGREPTAATLLAQPVTAEEFGRAKIQAAADIRNRDLADWWLDAETYKFTVADDVRAFENVSLPDVQRVAQRLASNPVASVAVVSAMPSASTSN